MTTMGKRPRVVRLLVALVVLLTAALVSTVGTATPAQAATCRTAGHTYLIFNGSLYFSGYEGDMRFGVPSVTMARGSRYELGGNGIAPSGNISYAAEGPVTYFQTIGPAGSNCVVNQRAFFQNAIAGNYRLFATYNVPGRGIVDEPVVDITVT